MNRIQVYCYDGTKQCGMGQEVSLEVMENRLTENKIAVYGRKKGVVPFFFPAACGYPTGNSNVYTIEKSDFNRAKELGFQLWPFDLRSMAVYKPDGTLQCNMGEEIPLEVMAKELEDAGVQVISMRKGHDGQMHLTVCGATTGNINIFQIPTHNWPVARDLGFMCLNLLPSSNLDDIAFKPLRDGTGGEDVPWPW